MASVEPEAVEPARKRQKLFPASSASTAPDSNHNLTADTMPPPLATTKSIESTTHVEKIREAKVGITQFVNNANSGFAAVLKQRYTDFLVNEVLPDGTVVHLTSLYPLKPLKINKGPEEAAESTRSMLATEAATAASAIALGAPTTPNEGQDASGSQPVDGKENGSLNIKKDASTNLDVAFTLSDEDIAILDSYFGPELRDNIVRMHRKILEKPDAKPFIFGSLVSRPIHDREQRTKIHQDMRRIFNSSFETSLEDDLGIKIRAAPRKNPQASQGRNGNDRRASNRDQPRGKVGWNELGGENLHFSVYKENKDTMEVVSYIAKMLNLPARKFGIAGTKDRRAVTVQRVSVPKVRAEQVASLNKLLRQASVGNFTYEKHGLELGELAGNEFTITLRDAECEGFQGLKLQQKLDLMDLVVGEALKGIQKDGFINYYGLQRFGTHAIGTDDIGKKILKGDFKGAVDDILSFNPQALDELEKGYIAGQRGIPRDEVARSHAINIWSTTGRSAAALEKMPRKYSGETAIIRHLGRRNLSKDYAGAILQITRNLRLMYVHAYQSLVWNMVASERWARFGKKVISGDLVIVDTNRHANAEPEQEVDESGEIIIRPAVDDSAVTADDLFERARPLTEDEAASGRYTIFDIVLPTPGFDVEFPNNEIGDYYKEFMGSERGGGLDPANMRRSHKDFSLSGSYRKLMGVVGADVSYEIKPYRDETTQLVETDLDKINKQEQNIKKMDPSGAPVAVANPKDSKPAEVSKPVDVKALETEELMEVDTATIASTVPRPEALVQGKKPINSWKHGWSSIAEQDAVMDAARRAADAAKPKASPPSFKQIFIQTEPNAGKRTGLRVATIVPTIGIVPGIRNATMDAGTQTGAAATTSVGTQTQAERDSLITMETTFTRPDTSCSSDFSADGGVALADEIHPENIGHKRPAEETLESVAKHISQLDGTDDRLTSDEPIDETTKIAVVVKFQLGSSQYATMALRELMHGCVKPYKPDFNLGGS